MSTKLVKKYETKVPPRFYTACKTVTKPAKSTLFLGLELEVEYSPYSTWRQKEFLLSEISAQWWYTKYDPTVPNGIELITHPATSSWYKKNYEEIAWRLDLMKIMDCRTSSQCGVHIHMNKSAFTSNQFLNFQKLIYDYPEFTLELSGRTEENLKRWASIYHETKSDILYKAKNKKSPPDLRHRIVLDCYTTFRKDKFVAVNVLKKNTNEVRIFAASLDPNDLYKCLEFCEAAHAYSGLFKIVTLEGFVRWVYHNESKYPHLANFLQKHNYVV